MKYIFPFLLLLLSCQKEPTECFCRRQVWKIEDYDGNEPFFQGMQTATFSHYDPYYREDCWKADKWYVIDSTKRYFLICDL